MKPNSTIWAAVQEVYYEKGWGVQHCWKHYSEIIPPVNEKIIQQGKKPYRSSTIDRIVRMMTKKGPLEGDRRGNFRWKYSLCQ